MSSHKCIIRTLTEFSKRNIQRFRKIGACQSLINLAIYINDRLSFRLSVVVAYRPVEGGDAHPALERDGVIEIYGPTNIRSLLPLRAIFCKIFPAQNSFELKPELFQKDERFAGLSLGLCRVSRGWFAISVVRNDLVL